MKAGCVSEGYHWKYSSASNYQEYGKRYGSWSFGSNIGNVLRDSVNLNNEIFWLEITEIWVRDAAGFVFFIK